VLKKKEVNRVKLWAEALNLINSNEEILALSPILDNSMPIGALSEPKSGGFRYIFTISYRTVNVNIRRRNEYLWKVYNIKLDRKPGPRGASIIDKGSDPIY
jgi:hypothetical protein